MAGKGKRAVPVKRENYEGRVGYRPRRSGATPTVAQPDGPLAHELEIIAMLHPEVMSYIDEAVDRVFKLKCGQLTKPKVWLRFKRGLVKREVEPVSAEQIIAAFVDHVMPGGDWLDWKTMLNVVRDICIADPRYYGITDPTSEQHCSKCRKVKKLNEFPPGRIRCYDCGEWREDGPRRA